MGDVTISPRFLPRLSSSQGETTRDMKCYEHDAPNTIKVMLYNFIAQIEYMELEERFASTAIIFSIYLCV